MKDFNDQVIYKLEYMVISITKVSSLEEECNVLEVLVRLCFTSLSFFPLVLKSEAELAKARSRQLEAQLHDSNDQVFYLVI